MMKKLINKSLIVFLAFGLMACGSDDDSSSSNSIVGTWKLTNATENGVAYFDPNNCEDQETWIFYENGNFRSIYQYLDLYEEDVCIAYNANENATYEINGDQVRIIYEINDSSTFVYSLNSNTLVLTYNYYGDVDVYTLQRID